MPLKIEQMSGLYRILGGFFNELFRNESHSFYQQNIGSIHKYELRYADLTDMPGEEDGILTVLIWLNKNQAEPDIINHWYLIGGQWKKK